MTKHVPATSATSAPESARWFQAPEVLDKWLESLAPGTPLVLDTEFERVSTFYPVPGLVQLGAADQFWLVEPDVAASSERFRQELASPDRWKLLYAMSEDLELFRHWLNIEPQGVIDLQIGAALAGEGFSVGYARLVENLFGRTLDKSFTRSDWISRPLSAEQERYALDDIRFLEPLHQQLLVKLRNRGFESALIDESRRFADEAAEQNQPETYYLKLRGGWALGLRQQLILKKLVIWREQQCRQQDKPRNRVLSDSSLIAVAEHEPDSLDDLKNIQGIPGGFVRHYGPQVLEQIVCAASANPDKLTLISRPLSREQQALYKTVKKYVKTAAEVADIPIELLAPRKRLERVIQEGSLADNPFFGGWRKQVLAPVWSDIEDALHQ